MSSKYVHYVPSKNISLPLMISTVVKDIPVGVTTLCSCWKCIGFEHVADYPLTYDFHWVGPLRQIVPLFIE